jgi:hypothetical protein
MTKLSRIDVVSILLISVIAGGVTHALTNTVTIFGINFSLFVSMWSFIALVAAVVHKKLHYRFFMYIAMSLINGWAVYFRLNGTVQFFAATASLVFGYLALLYVHNESFNGTSYFARALDMATKPFMSFAEGVKDIALACTKPSGRSNALRASTIMRYVFVLSIVSVFLVLFSNSDSIFGSLFSWVDDVIQGVLNMSIFSGDSFTLAFWILFSSTFVYMAMVQVKMSFFSTPRIGVNLSLPTRQLLLRAVTVVCVLFALLQVYALFIGGELPGGLSYADYARRGYGQLVLAVILGVVVVFIAGKNSRNSSAADLWISTALVVSLGLILASAWRRLTLYEEAFGPSLLRLQARFGMGVIAVLLMLVALYIVSRISVKQFYGYAWLSVGVASTLFVVINPARYVASRSIQTLGSRETTLDITYLMSLGRDVYPTLCKNLDTIRTKHPESYKDIMYYPYGQGYPQHYFNEGEWFRDHIDAKAGFKMLEDDLLKADYRNKGVSRHAAYNQENLDYLTSRCKVSLP